MLYARKYPARGYGQNGVQASFNFSYDFMETQKIKSLNSIEHLQTLQGLRIR